MLDCTGLRPAFHALVSAQEVERGKPAPDVYLRAAELLGADPAACIAIEDSAHGVTAALAAGMTVVQARQTSHPFPQKPGVAAVVESLCDFELRWRPAPGEEPQVALFTEAFADSHYALVMLVPPQAPFLRGADLLICVDGFQET